MFLGIVISMTGLIYWLNPGGMFFKTSGSYRKTNKTVNDFIELGPDKALINGINAPAPQAGQLILYNSKFGYLTPKGSGRFELKVEANRIIGISVGQTEIPPGGFVISGGGKAGDFLKKNSGMGRYVTLSGKIVQIRENPQVIYATLSTEIYQTNVLYSKVSGNHEYQWNKAVPFLLKANQYFNEVIQSASQASIENDKYYELLQKASDSLEKANLNLIRTPDKEVRGVIYRLNSRDPQVIKSFLDNMVARKFNTLFIETWYHGYTIYPSKIADQNPMFRGMDPLEIIIKEAHKRGLSVICWSESFYIGQSEPDIKWKHNDWMGRNRQGGFLAMKDDKSQFLCPSNDSVRQYLLDVNMEMASKYHIDGIVLDFLRYPDEMRVEEGLCYDSSCRAKFKAQYHYDPILIKNSDDKKITQWKKFREDEVTKFVAENYKVMKKNNPHLSVGAFVFSRTDTLGQNWQEWLNKDLLDYYAVMVLSQSCRDYRDGLSMFKRYSTPRKKIIAGIYYQADINEKELSSIINVVRNENIEGVFFSSDKITSDNKRDFYDESVFWKKASLPKGL